ncbi:unnamed protein product [Cuscuta epithymum]|uniref:Uncharacterized protein n=1 Tax=Cuscuta epithymum TaxID=186058 RepID=A0AAV0EZP6_9ASTE|nr:unnamed protein product [Cuscuta epithymum]
MVLHGGIIFVIGYHSPPPYRQTPRFQRSFQSTLAISHLNPVSHGRRFVGLRASINFKLGFNSFHIRFQDLLTSPLAGKIYHLLLISYVFKSFNFYSCLWSCGVFALFGFKFDCFCLCVSVMWCKSV